MILSIAEILNKADQAATTGEKIQTLRENYSDALKDILIGAYDDRVEWALPSGPVPFRKGPDRESEGMLIAQTRTFYLYTKGGGAPVGLSQMRRESLFVQMLESLHPDDAKVVIAMKDKQLPYKTITRDLVNAAFPKMIYSTPERDKRKEWIGDTVAGAEVAVVEAVAAEARTARTPQVNENGAIVGGERVVKRGRGRPTNASKAAAKEATTAK